MDLTDTKWHGTYGSSTTATVAGYSVEIWATGGSVLTIDSTGAHVSTGGGQVRWAFSDLTELDASWSGAAGAAAAMQFGSGMTAGVDVLLGLTTTGAVNPDAWLYGAQYGWNVGGGQYVDLRYNGTWRTRNSGGPTGSWRGMALQSAGAGMFGGFHDSAPLPQPALPRLLNSASSGMADNGDDMAGLGDPLFNSSHPCRQLYFHVTSAGTSGAPITDLYAYDLARLAGARLVTA